MPAIFQDRKAVYMDAYGKVRLALVRLTTTNGIFTDGSELTFDKWVPDKIAPWVVSKSEQKVREGRHDRPEEDHGARPGPVTGGLLARELVDGLGQLEAEVGEEPAARVCRRVRAVAFGTVGPDAW